MNGIMVKGNAAGVTMYYGAGAGSRETASAVVADLVDLARALRGGGRMCVPPLGFHDDSMAAPRMRALANVRMRNYLRFTLQSTDAGPRVFEVLQRHGVLADKGTLSHDSLVMLTNAVAESQMLAALRELETIEGVHAAPARLRVEELE
jgi:homoserine dehydrogenase